MLRTLAARPARRRGSVLIVVLAMLVLFAVLGLSFVLYSESQLSAARSQKASVSIESEPNPLLAFEGWMGPFIYDVGDVNDDLMNPVRGHSLARSKQSVRYDDNPASATFGQFVPTFVPFSGSPPTPADPAFLDPITVGAVAFTDKKQIVRFTWEQANGAVVDPERFYNGALPRNASTVALNSTLHGTYRGKNYPFTYPDRHDFHLASQDPVTGQITVPSFHRPELGNWIPSDALNFETQGPAGKYRTLRPRVVDNPGFPAVPMNPDGTYTGDVANMRFITGSQRNDSLWMYAGGPVRRWREKNYVACVAPLILDLNSRVNLATAGNTKGAGNTHASKEGWGPWEVNPIAVGMTAADVQQLIQRRYGKTAADYTPPADPYTAFTYTHRINGQQHPLFTGGRMPRQGSLFDADGVGPAANDGPLTLPLTGTYPTTPIFNNPAVVAAPFRYEPTQLGLTTALTGHPAQYNPLMYSRQPAAAIAGGFGHDDLLKLAARFSDPKGRQATATFGQPALPPLASLNPVADTAAARTTRALTTTFSVSQHWAGVTLVGLTAADPTPRGFRLGPVDLNRPLHDFRKNPTLPPSPVNMWNPAVGAELNNWYAAQSDRQRLARDIFVRVAARYGLINGTTAIFRADTGVVEVFNTPGADVSGNTLALMRIAQFAVNLVDYIDGDDIVTPFVWRPVTPTAADPLNDPANFAAAEMPTRVVYGTEQPRLVINEVYSGVFNTRTDPFPAVIPGQPRASLPAKRRYWIELYNPTPGTNTSSPGNAPVNFLDPTLSDTGYARLRYEPNGALGTQVQDPTTGAPVPYAGVDYNPYRIDVAVAPNATTTPYAAALGLPPTNAAGGYGAAGNDPTAVLPPATVVMARVNTFVPAVANAALPGDAANVVLPDSGTSGLPGGTNAGHYLIGPQDPFPGGGVNNSMSLRDPRDPATGNPVPGVPPANPPLNGPVDALTFDVTAGAPSNDDIAGAATPPPVGELNRPSTVILRRLLNPYLPPNDPANNDTRFPYDATRPANPYITVDFVENIPTRDRVQHTAQSSNRPQSNAPSVGRIHPFAAFPDYGTATLPAVAAVQDQGGAAAPIPHTFFGVNNPADNTRGTPAPGTYGFEWMPHLDRELVSLPEAAHASRTSPALLTHAFFNGTSGTGYHGHAVGMNSPLFVPLNSTALNVPNDYLRMLTDCEGLLTCGSRLPGVPLGGREPGKVNINTTNDLRVLRAVFDPQGGNGFTTPGYVDPRWAYITPTVAPTGTQIVRTPTVVPNANAATTPNGLPRATVHEGGTDYPFMFGSTSLTTGVNPPRDHPFGRSADPIVNPNGLIFPNYNAPPTPAVAANHPYLANEPLRKAWNNLTPTSDGFLVLVTVGFFEVTNAGPWNVNNQPVLGAELHDKVPGDLRAQYAAVVDRSQLATQVVDLSAASPVERLVAADPATNPVGRGVQTKLVADVAASTAATNIHIEAIPPLAFKPDGTQVAAGTCAVLGDGVVYTIGGVGLPGVSTRIHVGFGDSTVPGGGDGEWLTVTNVAQRQLPDAAGTLQNVPGQVTLTVAAVTRPHAAGDPVGNVVYGNPGPQPGVTMTQLRQRGLVPYFTRLEP